MKFLVEGISCNANGRGIDITWIVIVISTVAIGKVDATVVVDVIVVINIVIAVVVVVVEGVTTINPMMARIKTGARDRRTDLTQRTRRTFVGTTVAEITRQTRTLALGTVES